MYLIYMYDEVVALVCSFLTAKLTFQGVNDYSRRRLKPIAINCVRSMLKLSRRCIYYKLFIYDNLCK